MKYTIGDIVIIDNKQLRNTMTIYSRYRNIAIINNHIDNDYIVAVDRKDINAYSTSARISEDGILQLLPKMFKVNYTYTIQSEQIDGECYISNFGRLINSETGNELDYMNLRNFRIKSSYNFKPITNELMNKIYKALGSK